MAQPQLYDFEIDPLQSQLATARALRKKGMDEGGGLVSGIYVGNAGSQFMNALAGSAMEDTAHRGLGDVQRRRDAEEQSWMARRPDTMMDQTTPGTPAVTQEFPGADAFGGEGGAPVTAEVSPATLPMTKRVMKPYEQQVQDVQGWAGASPQHSPLGQSMRAAMATQALAAPQKALEREDAQAARKEVLTATIEAKKDAERIRAEDKATEKEKDRLAVIERDKQRAADAANMARLAAGLKPTPQPQIVTSDQGMFTLGRDGKLLPLMGPDGKTLMKPPTAGESKLSAAAQKRVDSRSDLRAKVERAKQMNLENPDAAGWKTLLVPNKLLGRTGTGTEQISRAASGEVAAEKAHELYGAAFTAAEMKRAGKFLPEDGDSTEQLDNKFKNILDILDATETKPIGPAKPATGVGGIPLESGLTPEQEKRRQELKAKHGR